MVIRAAASGILEDRVESLVTRYKAAFDKYQNIVDRNFGISMRGDELPCKLAAEEERALEALDFARNALMTAVEQAYPTMH